MKLVIIFGPQAVGKMTVGQELAKITDLKLFHNHMTIDLVSNFHSYGTREGKRLVGLFREEIFKSVANSDLSGLIFTYVWAFNVQEDWDYIDYVSSIFKDKGAKIYLVELEASVDERIKRNNTPNRLKHKPTKQNVEFSQNDLISSMDSYRMNSLDGEINNENYLHIYNNDISAIDAAKMIKDRFNL